MAMSSLNDGTNDTFFQNILSHYPSLKDTLLCLRNEMNHGHEIRDLASKTRKRNKRGQGLPKILKLPSNVPQG